MNKSAAVALAALSIAACAKKEAKETAEPAEAPPAIVYPVTKKADATDVYHGVTVADPYRWLENDVRIDKEVEAWVAAQNEATFSYLKALPGRAEIEKRITELFDYERFGLPDKEGGKYFHARNDGLQNQSPLYVADQAESDGRLLIDPNTWSSDGTVALAGGVPSPDGSKYAYLVQEAGSDWNIIEVVDTATGAKRADRVEWVKFSGLSWSKDGAGFYYSRYPAPARGAKFTALNRNQKVYFHKLGDPQAKDKVVIEDPSRPDVGWSAAVTDDGRYLSVSSFLGTDGNGVRVKDLATGAVKIAIDDFKNNHVLLGNIGTTFLIQTDLGAPNHRIVAADFADLSPGEWRDVVAEGKFPIDGASLVGGKLVVSYLEDAKSVVKVFEPTGVFVRDVALPGIGTASGFGGKVDDSETFYSFSSFNRPSTVYRYDVATGESRIVRAPKIKFNPDDYVVEQVFFDSTGGARVPMFVVHKKGLDRKTPHPTLLYGYGGFNVSVTPSFSASRLQWMEMGGVFALANIRGGGEYGRDWHDGGRLAKKQNVFDDFIRAGETLIEKGFASKETLAIQGGSNGGLLVGAVVNQRPDLFAAALPEVGVMDMLRFTQFTAGRFWVDDYGDPKNEADFKTLFAYSPLHNIKSGPEVRYPAVLVVTADTDDRVVPGHSFKYAAALQAAETGPNPKLIRIETRAGHGAGKPTAKIIEEAADKWAFIARHTGLKVIETTPDQ